MTYLATLSVTHPQALVGEYAQVKPQRHISQTILRIHKVIHRDQQTLRCIQRLIDEPRIRQRRDIDDRPCRLALILRHPAPAKRRLEGERVGVQTEIVIGDEECGFQVRTARQGPPDAVPALDGGAEVVDVFDVVLDQQGFKL